MDLPGPGALIGGRFRVESMLGRGGMGAVYAAIDTSTGRAVAVKMLVSEIAQNATAVARFMEEARAMARIEHPNVIAVIDVGRDGQHPFLVMERLRGESLRDRLTREGRLGVTDALDVLVPACRGVAEAHREGIVHRDLKPDNVFLAEEGGTITPKVLDFGLAKSDERVAAQLTRTGATLGTPSYMSPEQLAKPRDATVRFDIYAMGVVLYETLSGRLPYDGENMLVTIRRIAEGDPPPLRAHAPEVPPRLEAIVMRAMHVDASQRHASMEELVEDLEAMRAGYGATAHVPSGLITKPLAPPLPPARPRTKPPWWVFALLALVVIGPIVVACGVAGMLVIRDERRERPIASRVERPRTDLTFGGDCRIDTTQHMTVSAMPSQISIAWGTSGALHLYSDAPPVGSQDVTQLAQHGNTWISVAQGMSSWSSVPPIAFVGNQVGGRVVFHRFHAALGVASIEFHDVRLQSLGSVCTVDGTLRTIGPAR